MDRHQFRELLEKTETFKSFLDFKKTITLKCNNIDRLLDIYGQADRLGLDYIKQNPNIMSTDFKLIEEIINR